MNEGWIKLHRRFLEWEWFDSSDMIKIFVYFLLKANHKGKNWKGIKVERGQLITGRKKLAFKLKMSEQKIRTCMERLKTTSEITTKVTNKYSIITVTNYDSYNIKNDTKQPTKQHNNNQPATNQQPTNNQQTTTNKNDKKEKNVNNEKKYKEKITFYSNEIELNKEETLIDKYIALVSYLFGENAIGSPVEHILKLKNQLKYEEYKKLFSASHSKNLTVGELMDSWVNNPKYSKDKVSIYLTLNNWINRSDGKNLKPVVEKNWGNKKRSNETESLLGIINKLRN